MLHMVNFETLTTGALFLYNISNSALTDLKF